MTDKELDVFAFFAVAVAVSHGEDVIGVFAKHGLFRSFDAETRCNLSTKLEEIVRLHALSGELFALELATNYCGGMKL